MNERNKLKYHSAAVFVQNIEVSKKFYTELLQLRVGLDFGKNVVMKGGLTLWEINPGHIIPEGLGIDSISDRDSNRFELYFEAENIDDILKKVETYGVELLHPVHEEPWGQRTIRFFDPDRHLIEIGESMEAFVKRLYNSNMTPEQVAQKTSVPLEKVREILRG